MIWRLRSVDQTLLEAFDLAGDPDQRVINEYLVKAPRRPQSPQKHQGIIRRYYLLRDNPRIRLTTLGRPLNEFLGLQAKIIVGTNEIIGEFPGNRQFAGQTGLQLQCQPQGMADRELVNGTALLSEISEQILDQKRIEQSQQQIRQKYEWKKGRLYND